MHYLMEMKIELSSENDEQAKAKKAAVLSAALSAAMQAGGVMTPTMHKLTSEDGRVVEKFNHPMERAIFP